MNEEKIPGYDQIIHFDTDIVDSRRQASLTNGPLDSGTFDELVEEAERFLAGREIESTERIGELMKELEKVKFVNNDDRASALLREFEKKYRKEAVES